jgi:DNA anti-recombination protein RmuC
MTPAQLAMNLYSAAQLKPMESESAALDRILVIVRSRDEARSQRLQRQIDKLLAERGSLKERIRELQGEKA